MHQPITRILPPELLILNHYLERLLCPIFLGNWKPLKPATIALKIAQTAFQVGLFPDHKAGYFIRVALGGVGPQIPMIACSYINQKKWAWNLDLPRFPTGRNL